MHIQELQPVAIRTRSGDRENPFGFSLASTTRRQFIVTLDPEAAAYLIAHMHPSQRRPTPALVAEYVAKMNADSFEELMHPGIYADRDGWICNAHHRLLAQIEAKRTYRWYLVVGASPEEIAALDQTRIRRAHQSFNLVNAGERMTSREEAVIRQYIRMQLSSEDGITVYHLRIGPEDLATFRNGPFSEDVTRVISKVPVRVASAPVLAGVAYARPIAPESVDGFLQAFVESRLALPTDHPRNAPAVTLARWFNTSNGTGGGGYVDKVLDLTLCALRAHLQDREVAYLRNGNAPLGYIKKRRRAIGLTG